MADQIIGEAAEATAAEGGAVLLLPNAEAELAEQEDTTPPEQGEVASSPPAVVVSNTTVDDHMPELISAMIGESISVLRSDLDSRLDLLLSRVTEMESRLATVEVTAPAVEEVTPIESVTPVPESEVTGEAERTEVPRYRHKFGRN